MSDQTDRLPLADAIDALRTAIRQAAARAAPLKPSERFKITEVEIELTVVAEDTASMGGEIGWWIFKASARTSTKEGSTHKIKLKLDVGDVEVGSDIRMP